jgi:hypothetical protein
VDDCLTCVLANFGFAAVNEIYPGSDSDLGDRPDVRRWTAPELLDSSQFPSCDGTLTTAGDMYAFGCTTYEVCLVP